MFFSIIIPVYNVEKYIEECIDSVINQSCDDYEIILVNDGSNDSSKEICSRYQKKYLDKIILINQNNQGPFLARIEGIKRAKGEVIISLDGDDCLRVDCLEQLKNVFQEDDYDIVIFNASTVSDYSKPFRNYKLENGFIFENETKKLLYERMIISSEMNNLSIKAIKRSLFNTNTNFNKFLHVRHGEDLLQLFPVVTSADKIILLDKNLYYYRQREGSTVHKFDINRSKSIKTVHQELEKYIDIWNMQEYREKHYAREVKGWISTLRILLEEKYQMEANQYKKFLEEMASDLYFTNAYEKMDDNELDRLSAILAKWLYKKNFMFLDLFRVIKGICFWR